MRILTGTQSKDTDLATLSSESIASIDLMERASLAFAERFIALFPKTSKVIVIAGSGNNGGDALAIARILLHRGLQVHCILLQLPGKTSQDLNINKVRLIEMLKEKQKGNLTIVEQISDFPEIQSSDIVIDGIFGSGLNREIDGVFAELISMVNISENIISIDIPSGLFGDDNSTNSLQNIIRAKKTISFQTPKLSFFFKEYSVYVGDWHILNIGLNQDFINSLPEKYSYLCKEDIIIKKRDKYAHKGNFGHGLLIAGSRGMMGAAVLASKAAMRSGIGLLSTHAPACGYEILQSSVPEVLYSIDEGRENISILPDITKYNAIAVGPGIGANNETTFVISELLNSAAVPLIFDADAINILSENKELLHRLPENSIITPHPKEFDRLFGEHNSTFERFKTQEIVAEKFKIIIILKGHYTSISLPDKRTFFNSTGNSGMATAGCGDVLSGILLAMLAQNYSPEQAAINSVYLHGLAADVAIKKISEESLIASDIIDNLSLAFSILK